MKTDTTKTSYLEAGEKQMAKFKPTKEHPYPTSDTLKFMFQTYPVAIRTSDGPKSKSWRVPVRITICDSYLCRTDLKVEFYMTAKSAVEAANWCMDRLRQMPSTTVEAWGPKGGRTTRFNGWNTAMEHAMVDRKPDKEAIEEVETVLGIEPNRLDWTKTNLILRGE
jgi:hypothetical protein